MNELLNKEGNSRFVVPGHIRMWLAVLGFLFGLATSFFGLGTAEEVLGISLSLTHAIFAVTLGGVLGSIALSVVAPAVVRGVMALGRGMERRLTHVPLSDILVGTVGLIFGLIIANLLGSAFSGVPVIGGVAATVAAVIFGYLGWIVAVNKKPDLVSWGRAIRSSVDAFSARGSAEDDESASMTGIPKVIDSSAVIDGRIADVCRSGFLDGPLVIPQFVLEEVQHIADSSDAIRRSRGRRGLDILNTIQKDLDVEVVIYRPEKLADGEVDAQLLQVARDLGGKIVTNDYNLNKVAVLQGVSVLNINDLANALKPMVIPGEQMTISLIKEGKEPGQGVGYLDDGTMVVVDHGRPHIGEEISVSVTSVLQTSAGRMIFARPQDLANAAP
ncbi:MAG: TRAM domain-containing protein [Bacillota bacterium]